MTSREPSGLFTCFSTGSLHIGWSWSLPGWSALLVEMMQEVTHAVESCHIVPITDDFSLQKSFQDNCQWIVNGLRLGAIWSHWEPRIHWTFHHFEFAGPNSSSGSPSAKALPSCGGNVPYLSYGSARPLARFGTAQEPWRSPSLRYLRSCTRSCALPQSMYKMQPQFNIYSYYSIVYYNELSYNIIYIYMYIYTLYTSYIIYTHTILYVCIYIYTHIMT